VPYNSLRKCTYPGCNVLVKSGRCPTHSTKRIDRDPKVKRLYNSPQWRSLRAAQLAEDPWCAACMSRGEHTLATEVDHIVRHHGDAQLFFDATNLQSLCKVDHSKKTREEVWGSDPPVKKSYGSQE
jgi:5-methylcytosine-specific restriction protein A